MAQIAKALGDPVRIQLGDVLRKHAGKACVYELLPLLDLSQPTLSHHLKKLRDARIVDVERRGLWAYYYVLPGALDELAGVPVAKRRGEKATAFMGEVIVLAWRRAPVRPRGRGG